MSTSSVPQTPIEQHPPTAGAPSIAQIDITERPARTGNGFLGILAVLILLGIAAWILIALPPEQNGWAVVPAVPLAVIAAALVAVSPGNAWVVEFFGRYAGTVRATGLSWLLPFTLRRKVSIKVRNFETSRIKVNDASGNPIEIGAVVVWRVVDTAKAVYAVDDFTAFVSIQSESALRHVASVHRYDGGDGEVTLRGSTDRVSAELAAEVDERVAVAGIDIVEVRISHLAYAPEIAQAMLRRQQADAVVSAKTRVVEGAVGMVDLALTALSERNLVELDDERKAAMVSNLMVVLCSDQGVSPVVNAGTLY